MITETSLGLKYYCNHLDDAEYAYILFFKFRIGLNGI